MADKDQLIILKRGVNVWNEWRRKNENVKPDLSSAELPGINLSGANLSDVNLTKAYLSRANLSRANLRAANLRTAYLRNANLNMATLERANLQHAYLEYANLTGAQLERANFNGAILEGIVLRDAHLKKARLEKVNLRWAQLERADLSEASLLEADLRKADLSGANLRWANLRWANLQGADLKLATLVETRLDGANLLGCRIYGISAWKVDLEDTIQTDLIITANDEPVVTVDNLELAQFVYLLLNNERIRDVINTIGQRAVLILGRFTLPERKEILDGMRELLREKGFLPIVFDFEKSVERDITETIKVLAGMCLFVIADITNPKSSPLELQATVPDYMIPFAPIIQEGELPFAMFVDLQHKYRGVLDVRTYSDKEHLLSHFENGIIRPALQRHNELLILKNQSLTIRSIDEP